MWSYRELPIGVEVDRDLSSPMTAQDEEQFRELFFEHSLLRFRRQSLTERRQAELCSLLGPVPGRGVGDVSAVHQIALDGALGASELVYHSDLAFDDEPYVGVSLHALAIEPEGASSTEFVSGTKAYQTLPADLRQRVEGLSARHVFPLRTDVRSGPRPSSDYPSAIHPLVWNHPVTGRPILFVAKQTTTEIVGLTPEDSDDLLARLFDHLYRPAAVFGLTWHSGDAVLWDNRALQHARPEQTGVQRRVLQRVVIGRGTVGELYGDFLAAHKAELANVAHSAPVGE